ncbi:DUF1801 domain-containing protein [Wenyingzhuangia marina]|nr:DUF1801 domain-containing protein [Wenyingzhuangia marina]
MDPKVDEYFEKLQKWQLELQTLREILNDCMLTETYKWKHPCYKYKNNNIVIIGGFKEYCTINFFKGVLLKDSEKILTKPGENSQSSRIIPFTNVEDIKKLTPIIKSYIFEAIEIEKAGLTVQTKSISDYKIPDELTQKFTENLDFETAFKALTPGRQKGYLLYFSQPKQSKTKISRIEKYTNRILKGKGLNDCICGLSKRMPTCDGSHKYIK